MPKKMTKEEQAEYMRNYRATVKPLNERNARTDGLREGITRVVAYLREKVGGSAITGFQAALMVERAMLETESFSAATRQRFIENMRKV